MCAVRLERQPVRQETPGHHVHPLTGLHDGLASALRPDLLTRPFLVPRPPCPQDHTPELAAQPTRPTRLLLLLCCGHRIPRMAVLVGDSRERRRAGGPSKPHRCSVTTSLCVESHQAGWGPVFPPADQCLRCFLKATNWVST